MELVDLLTQQLEIKPEQASGGLGLLLGAAKNQLGKDFGQVTRVVPEAEDLIQQVPKPEGAPGATGAAASGGAGDVLGAVTGLLGGKAGGPLGSLGNLASLSGGFKQLGLSTDMTGRFVPILLDFLQSKGGDSARMLLERTLK